MTFSTFAPLLAAGLAALFLILILIPLGRALGLVDRPGGRKLHLAPTPVTGGLAMWIAAVAIGFLMLDPPPSFAAFGVGAGIVTLVGLLDDRVDLPWWSRIGAQILAALAMLHIGDVRIHQLGALFGDGIVLLGPFAVAFTVFAVVGIINALNMIDGSDGLAGGLTLVSLALLAILAASSNHLVLLRLMMPLIGVVLAFLAFNFRFPWQRNARVFMGNAGSAFLGFAICWAAIRVTQSGSTPVAAILAPWIVAVPLIDCLVLIARRMLHGRSPFAADRQHLHHLMLEAGFTHGQVALTLMGAAVLLGGGAIFAVYNGTPDWVLFVAFLVLLAGHFAFMVDRDRAVAQLHRLHRNFQTSAPANG